MFKPFINLTIYQYVILYTPKALWLNWHLPMHKVFGGLEGKGFELRD